MIQITLKDGSSKSYPKGITVFEVAKDISEGLARIVVAGEVDGQLTDLRAELDKDCKLNLLTFDSPAGKHAYWHTASHIMAQAVLRLFPSAKLAIGPAIDTGFYYDFDIDRAFTPEDLAAIENEIKKIIKEDIPVERFSLPRAEALELMKDEPYKIELINDLPEDAEISFYKQGDFTDLCAGPHLLSTGKIKVIKLMQLAGAYWRGDEKNKMLQRIYGIAFPKASLLDEHLKMIEEAEKRDHRRLGKELDLFSFNEEVGPGLVLWHPKGARIRMRIEDFWRKQHAKNGYDIVYTPHIGRGQLWETSGHLDFYRDGMYSAMDVDGQDFFAKPMNCPFHIAIYNSKLHSYRDLPYRWAELGTVYRYEKSGALHGLLRVRGFTQDDAHLFCAPEQMPDEIRRVLRFCLYMLNEFGFENYKIYVSTKPKDKFVGDESMWEDATKALKDAVEAEGLECDIDEGGGAFYGPKIDIKIKDALNREWQCSTIQFDFNEPERFDMTYIASDGSRKRPYMIHRALLGSIERFFGVLVEHYAGAFPVWLAPVQVKLLPILDKHHDYADKVAEKLREHDIDVEIDSRNEKIGFKIREARLEKVPYILVIGDKEVESNSVAVRSRKEGELGAIEVDAFVERIVEEVRTRAR
ncbi:MAG: threonine--tRNA ligase [Acetivibrionales bacterium]|jgi:threonyl-tRNA synthetase|nr:threonine--tRNA ligase [Clostridiaceae bacterium]